MLLNGQKERLTRIHPIAEHHIPLLPEKAAKKKAAKHANAGVDHKGQEPMLHFFEFVERSICTVHNLCKRSCQLLAVYQAKAPFPLQLVCQSTSRQWCGVRGCNAML